jgi:anti-sigma B factor antagonist
VPVAQHLQVAVRTEGTVAVIALHGELDLASAALLDAEVDRPEVMSARDVVLDLRDLQFIDSTGLRTLFGAYQRASARGQGFALTDGSPQVQRLLAITRMGEHMTIVSSPQDLAGGSPAG